MTFRKYLRLFLVSVLPLLLLGLVVSVIVFPYSRNASVLCIPGIDFSDCHSFSGENRNRNFEDYLRKQHDAWFDIDVDETMVYLDDYIQGSGVSVLEAEVVDVIPVTTLERSTSEIAPMLSGRTAWIGLGASDGVRSRVDATDAQLWCNQLEYLPEVNHYSSYCSGKDWVANVKFTVPVDGRDYRLLQGLRSEIETTRRDRQWGLALYCLIVVPMFVYAFLLVSGIIWLVAKAVSYVRNG